MDTIFDVIIIGGSYAGLSAAMALGRSLRTTLVIDSGKPCNWQTPHAHNFITHDGHTPQQIAEAAKQQVLQYPTVKFHEGLAVSAKKLETGFEINTEKGEVFTTKKLLFTTGITDEMPAIKGFAECWGISVLHCPYCHGYEVKNEALGLIGNGHFGFDMMKNISHWSSDFTLFTNGKSELTAEQAEKLASHNIAIVEDEIAEIEHANGYLKNIVFANGKKHPLKAVFARAPFKQHCPIPEQLGCETIEHGHIKIDDFHRTTVPGVYAAGDNSSLLRAVAMAIASGNKTGAVINKDLIEEEF